MPWRVPASLLLTPHEVDSEEGEGPDRRSFADRVGAMLRRALEKSGVKKYYRLRVLCEAKLDSPCCTYEGVEHGLEIEAPGGTVRRLLPVLRLASGVLKVASFAGVAAVAPAGLPWVEEMGAAQEVAAALDEAGQILPTRAGPSTARSSGASPGEVRRAQKSLDGGAEAWGC